MESLRHRINLAQKERSVPFYVVERDYIQSYILSGIAQHTLLKDSLVFKGGTALKKVYFGDYRFSEDLDFSLKQDYQLDNALSLLEQVCISVAERLEEYGHFELKVEPIAHKDTHPGGQEDFNIFVQFPWHRRFMCTIKVEITKDEMVLQTPNNQKIIHGYGEPLEQKIASYQLEEIVVEKLRTLLQTHKKLIERGWGRNNARDYYDLWRIFTDYSDQIQKREIPLLLKEKCKLKGVTYQKADDFFTTELVSKTKQSWQQSLDDFVTPLPNCEKTLDELKQVFDENNRGAISVLGLN